MTNESRMMLTGFVATLLIALALVATYWIAQGWKIEKPFPHPLLVIPGQIAAIIAIAVLVWLYWWFKGTP